MSEFIKLICDKLHSEQHDIESQNDNIVLRAFFGSTRQFRLSAITSLIAFVCGALCTGTVAGGCLTAVTFNLARDALAFGARMVARIVFKAFGRTLGDVIGYVPARPGPYVYVEYVNQINDLSALPNGHPLLSIAAACKHI